MCINSKKLIKKFRWICLLLTASGRMRRFQGQQQKPRAEDKLEKGGAFTESQNHRKFGVGRDLCESSSTGAP